MFLFSFLTCRESSPLPPLMVEFAAHSLAVTFENTAQLHSSVEKRYDEKIHKLTLK